MPASRPRSALAPHVVTVVLIACTGACGSSSSGTNNDSNASDSGAIDAGAIDSGTTDASAADSGVTDSSATDSRAPDPIATDSMAAPSMAASCIDGVAGTWQNITPPAVATVLEAEGLDASSGGPSNNGSWGTSTV